MNVNAQPPTPDPPRPPEHSAPSHRQEAARIALTYLAIAAIWILGSDHLVSHWITDPERRIQLGIVKGWTFVILTAALLYLALRRALHRVDRTRADLIESEQRFRHTFEKASIGIAHVHADGRFLRVNPCLAEWLGFSTHELLSRTFQDVTHPDDLDADLYLLRRALAGDIATYQMEKRYLRRDGSVIWGHLSTSLIPTPSGDPYFLSIIKDISETKHTELALRASETRFRLMADHAPVLVWVSDVHGQATFHSASWYRFTGLSPAMSLDQPWNDAVHPDDLDLTRRHFLDAATRESSFRLECRLRYHDGSYRWVVVAGNPSRDPHGRFLGFIGSALDITHHRVAEQEFRDSRDRFRALLARQQEILDSSSDPRPASLEVGDLLSAFQQQLDEFRHQSGLSCSLTTPNPCPPLPPRFATTLFHILRECLDNIAHHARATQVRVTLSIDRDQVLLRVHDDGCGIPSESLYPPSALGLFQARERSIALGGTFDAKPLPDRGTLVSVRLPLPSPPPTHDYASLT